MLLFITSVCFCFASEMLNVVLPLYVTEDLGKTAAVSGLMTTFYTITSAVSRPVNGLLTDKCSRRIVMAVAAPSTPQASSSAAWGALIDAAGYVTTYRLTACGYGLMMVIAVILFARRKRGESHLPFTLWTDF